jgi:hypothetical protein
VRKLSLFAAKGAFLAAVALACSAAAVAQRHGERAAPNILTRPDGVDTSDPLRDFHQALAVQATTQQIGEFQVALKSTDAAKAKLQVILQNQKQKPAAALTNPDFHKALEDARDASKKFIDGFSNTQKTGLKEASRRMDKADATLAEEEKKFDEMLRAPGGEFPSSADALDKALTEFSDQQFALGREMGIVLANAQDVTFNLPALKTTVNVAREPLQITVSGVLSQTSVSGTERTFRLELMGNMSDLQQNITDILRAELDSDNSCGERVAVRQAMVMPAAPAGVLNLQLHYERWSCVRLYGQTTPNELAESDGNVEIKLVPAIENSRLLKLSAEFGRIDASGAMADAIRLGDMGNDLRDKVAKAVLTAIGTTGDLKTTLPLALQGSATLQNASFEDVGAGVLAVLIEGQVQISDEQAKALARQLNQTLSAQESGPQ